MHWWLPNDEGYSPIIRSIRKFVEERSSVATDVPKEDLREMKQIFAALKLNDGPSSSAPNKGEGQGDSPDAQIYPGQNPPPAHGGHPPWYMLQR